MKREIFDMDNIGNRVTVTNGTTENYTTNELNQYTAIDGEPLTYDMNGNMTYDGYNTISYDYTNRPIYFDNPDYEVEIRYDAQGRRVEKIVLNKSTGETEYEAYVLNGYRVLSDIDETGDSKKSYIWGNGIDELIATVKGNGGKFDYYLTNHLGSITQITNDKAEVQESYTYSVYGKLTVYGKKGTPKSGTGTNKPAKPKVRYTYTGREWDTETTLYYYRARWYNSDQGRFASRDSISCTSTVNLYSYVNNNPVNMIDPSGWQVVTYPVANPEQDCHDSWLTIWITVRWAVLATQEKINIFNAQRTAANNLMKKCCLKVKAEINWDLIEEGATVNGWDATNSRYHEDLVNLASNFDTSGGTNIPVIMNEDVVKVGGISLDSRYDSNYTGPSGVVLPTNGSAPSVALIHEIGHLAGLNHTGEPVGPCTVRKGGRAFATPPAGQTHLMNPNGGQFVDRITCECLRDLGR